MPTWFLARRCRRVSFSTVERRPQCRSRRHLKSLSRSFTTAASVGVVLFAIGCGDRNSPTKSLASSVDPNKGASATNSSIAGAETKTGSTTESKTGSSKGPTSVGKANLVIAVIPKGNTHQFWKSVHAGAIKAAEELGGVEIRWNGPQKEDNREQQIQLVEGAVRTKVDAIVLAPLDRTALVEPVKRAKENKIPVVIIDSSLDAEDMIDSYVATDNFNGGKMAGKAMGEALGGKGSVVVLRYQVGSASTEQRENGFLEALKAFPEIKVASSDQYSGATREQAFERAQQLLTRFKEVDGWFCPCEPVTTGSLLALKGKGLLGKIKVVGFDSGADLPDAIKNDQVHALILQDPINMGYLGVKTAVAAVRNEKIQKTISTGENLVTKTNMNEARSKELLEPDFKKYLKE